MNRNNSLYTLDANGEKQFTAAGLLLQFWILSEGGGQILDNRERVLARRVFDNVMEAWHDVADGGAAPACIPSGRPAGEMSDVQLMQVIDTIEQACATIGAAQVFQIIYRPDGARVH